MIILRSLPESPGDVTPSSSQPSTGATAVPVSEPVASQSSQRNEATKTTPEFTASVEQELLLLLGDVTLNLPCDLHNLTDLLSKVLHADVATNLVEDLLHKFAAQTLIRFGSKIPSCRLNYILLFLYNN